MLTGLSPPPLRHSRDAISAVKVQHNHPGPEWSATVRKDRLFVATIIVRMR